MARPVTTADEIREMDRRTIEALGLPGIVLMENAGRGAAALVLEQHAAAGGGEVAILCGSGNNGGDGYVIARCLYDLGVPCCAYLAVRPDTVRGDARVHLDVLGRLGVPVIEVADESAAEALAPTLARAAVIVDALLGTGLRTEVRGTYRALLEAANAAPGRKVAIDVPSGVRADDGALLGTAFRADVTATFAAAKLGLYLYPGAACAGDVRVVAIGIPRDIVAAVGTRAVRAEWADVVAALPRRPRDGHKGTFGHCLILAGSPGKAGAALLAGEAALVAGAGLVTVATDRVAQARIEARVPELMIEWMRDTEAAEADASQLARLLAGKRAVVIGPGLGATPSTAGIVRAVTATDLPLVLDADALSVLGRQCDGLASRTAPTVLTPHPGEAGRLLGRSPGEIQADRMEAARAIAARTGAVVVLKGAPTLVVTPDGRLVLNATGNPGMGSGGTGDVLAGLLGGLLAQGLAAREAAVTAVFLHGQAGDEAALERGERALTAGALLATLPRVLRRAEASTEPP